MASFSLSVSSVCKVIILIQFPRCSTMKNAAKLPPLPTPKQFPRISLPSGRIISPLIRNICAHFRIIICRQCATPTEEDAPRPPQIKPLTLNICRVYAVDSRRVFCVFYGLLHTHTHNPGAIHCRRVGKSTPAHSTV